MKVWRFEHETAGFGPLCGAGIDIHRQCWSSFFKWHDGVDVVDSKLFNINFPYGIEEHHKFGCSSLEKLQDFLRENAQERLAEHGFILKCFECTGFYCEFPDGQVVFDSTSVFEVKV